MMTVSAIKALAGGGDGGGGEAPGGPRLSTDFLNRYAEALMLIGMAADDPDILPDLQAWRAVSYCGHFATSPLRCAPSALAAYDALAPARREGFENLCLAMTRLVTTATALLADRQEGLDAATIAEVAGDALRRQIGRATHFINANGTIDIAAVESRVLQAEVDALFRV
ncbi:MAG: hypothetical protein Q8S58_02535 [Bosea sp. (in: a-proteobacteria)]|uniref:hypothetical protein n=1 Tax=Bosea sp. (in: a-proteobacteria) TaxID=1871050 RepID=UPI0027340FB2|nr:hypothetical protein [Bosea sp. (in: a-proteobacteria)]MDP3257899.1 hypothetical protein [Bosea sp. (in: a-proteobacteria)]MDP3317985.1 hypothetical protein [Bosea sp. (in: a-proteobacteria)]